MGLPPRGVSGLSLRRRSWASAHRLHRLRGHPVKGCSLGGAQRALQLLPPLGGAPRRGPR
eukprot:12019867-Alexandrium_andersonii.AAC.1